MASLMQQLNDLKLYGQKTPKEGPGCQGPLGPKSSRQESFTHLPEILRAPVGAEQCAKSFIK